MIKSECSIRTSRNKVGLLPSDQSTAVPLSLSIQLLSLENRGLVTRSLIHKRRGKGWTPRLSDWLIIDFASRHLRFDARSTTRPGSRS